MGDLMCVFLRVFLAFCYGLLGDVGSCTPEEERAASWDVWMWSVLQRVEDSRALTLALARAGRSVLAHPYVLSRRVSLRLRLRLRGGVRAVVVCRVGRCKVLIRQELE
jgi:hypothetical protein